MESLENSQEVPVSGRVAGIDFGTVRIGIAVSDYDRTIASPWENYTRRSEKLDGKFFFELVQQERIVLFIVGLPLHSSGDESEKSAQARKFGSWLHSLTNVPVLFHDERYSSRFADELMASAHLTAKKRKEKRDKLAAYVILSSWLEASKHGIQPEENLPLDS